tara:strand:- start:119 stop:730 length:612 start_codon:yes stop_codon:yes gene_type:complete
MNFIGEYQIDKKVCSDLLEYYHSLDQSFKIPAKIYLKDEKSDRYICKENPKIKKATQVSINVSGIEGIPKALLLTESTFTYLKHLQLCLEKYIKKYKYSNGGSPFTIIEPMNIQHYKPGEGYYQWHTERSGSNFPQAARHLVFMTYLNTVTDKGGTEFYHQKVTTKAVAGKTLIWPADWTHQHRGVPSPTQEKTIITGWYSYV